MLGITHAFRLLMLTICVVALAFMTVALASTPTTGNAFKHVWHYTHGCGHATGHVHWNGHNAKQRFQRCTITARYVVHRPTPRSTSTPVPPIVEPTKIWNTPVPLPTPRPTPRPTPIPTAIPNTPATYWLSLLNQTRAAYGVAPLSINVTQSNGTGSCVGSQGHADAMAQSGQIWHTNPSYPAASFPNNLCVFWTHAGENVGESGGDEQSAITTIHNLMMSEQHDPVYCSQYDNHACNIINPAFRQVGFGFSQAGGNWYLDTDFLG